MKGEGALPAQVRVRAQLLGSYHCDGNEMYESMLKRHVAESIIACCLVHQLTSIPSSLKTCSVRAGELLFTVDDRFITRAPMYPLALEALHVQ